MRLQACLNGALTARDHPGVPVTPESLARDAAACRRVGADSLHIHPRDAQARETLAAADVTAALRAVRAAVPGMPVGISTGAWIPPGGSARLAPMRGWTVLPDFVSVNVHEPEAEAIVALMQARGIGVEAGISTTAAARRFIESRMPRYTLRVLVEITAPEPAAAATEAEAILAILDRAGIALPVLLHGEGGSVWPMVRMAARRSLAVRVGFEDGREMPGGAVAASNAALVAAAARIIADLA
jgi:uncharacterized protein (DUF849 family)